MSAPDNPRDPWWSIPESTILAALRAVADGADPDAVYAELYANADHEHPDG